MNVCIYMHLDGQTDFDIKAMHTVCICRRTVKNYITLNVSKH